MNSLDSLGVKFNPNIMAYFVLYEEKKTLLNKMTDLPIN